MHPLPERLRALQRGDDEGEPLRLLRGFCPLGDAHLLARLADFAGRSAPTLLTLFPAVRVAWADDEVDAREAKRLRGAAWNLDLDLHPPGWATLERWLSRSPFADDEALWYDFVEGLVCALPALDYEVWRRDAMALAWKLARASGGRGASAVSAVEH